MTAVLSRLVAHVGAGPVEAAMGPPRRRWWCPREGCTAEAPRERVYCEAHLDAARRDARRQLLRDAYVTVPAAFAGARFGRAELGRWVRSAPAVDAARSAVERSRVILVGPAGAGKTTLAACIAHAILDAACEPDASHDAWTRARRLRWCSSYDLATARQQSRLGDEAELVRDAIGASVLVVDDLGAEPRVATSAVGEVIYQRHAAGAQTIVTTGFAGAQLAEMYGDGIRRRLGEGAAIIRLGGAS